MQAVFHILMFLNFNYLLYSKYSIVKLDLISTCNYFSLPTLNKEQINKINNVKEAKTQRQKKGPEIVFLLKKIPLLVITFNCGIFKIYSVGVFSS